MVLDRLNKEIIVGSFIVYGSLLGRSATLQIGKVISISVNEEATYDCDRYKIRVRGVRQCKSYNFRTNVSYDTIELLKQGTLSFPDRIIVLRREDIPNNVLELLDTV